MSTNTGRHDKSHIKDWLARLAALFCTAVELIRKGVRSEHMVETLLCALQLFKENRLAGAVSFDAGQPGTLPENFRELLSMRIADLPIGGRGAQKYFHGLGIWFVGEAYQLTGLDDYYKGKAVKELEEALISIGLPTDLDPIKAGWQPPYWRDPNFMNALNIPVIEGINNCREAERSHNRGRHYLGNFSPSRFCRRLDEKQNLLKSEMVEAGLHAGMFLPPDWKSPTEEAPRSWLEYCERKRREEAEEAGRAADRRAQEAAEATEAQTTKTSPDRRLSFDKLFRRVDTFDWAVRTRDVLEHGNFVYVGQLIQRRAEELLRLKNCGRKSLRHVQNELAELDLFLGMSPDDPTIASFNIMLEALRQAQDEKKG